MLPAKLHSCLKGEGEEATTGVEGNTIGLPVIQNPLFDVPKEDTRKIP